jgi:transglutaminase-like putative cysteine protease/Flp pilus assembly protein TadD
MVRSAALVAFVAVASVSSVGPGPACGPRLARAAGVESGLGGELGRLVQLRKELRESVRSQHGPLAYVVLRRIWSEWDRADPAPVEELLADLSKDESSPAPIRAYAGLLEAYARRRRGDLDGARTRVRHLGFVDRWLAVGPFDNDGKAGYRARFDPEGDGRAPINLTRDYEGKDHRPARWRLLPSAASPYGWIDFGSFLRPSEQACVLATTFVRDARLPPGASRPASVWAGSTGALRVDWNGNEALADGSYRDLDSDRFAAGVLLESGWNRLTAKVCGDDRAPMLSLRVAGVDGAPDEHIEVDADPRHSTVDSTPDGETVGGSTAPAARKGGARPPVVRLPDGVEGPVQGFERLLAGGDPAVLEGYARYLLATGADDPTEHRARELARKAAEKAPTIPRLLLAAEAAEGRNQRASWLERAEEQVRPGQTPPHEAIQVLLARGDFTRGSVNPRDALPYYDAVLRLDPDNMPATLAKIDFYDDAGLHDTALALLHYATERNPRSVALLRALVAALREAGRETEAAEAAERYAALRFDDPTFLRAQIDLAVAARDAGALARWTDRLEAANPDSAGALVTAAQAWTRLGERTRAVAAYQGALDLAPEDTDVLRQLATAHALNGERDEQLRLLKRVLELAPQAKEVREQVAHLGPAAPRADEQYARPASEFLAMRTQPSAGQAQRSLLDLQVTSVFANGLASRFHQVVYQPLTDSAAAASREYAFDYESDSETVQLRAARVYRADGRIDEAVENGAGGMADDPALAIYTSSRHYYVHFPRLEPGDVVELQYRVEDVAPRNAFADYFGEVVYMEGDEPIERSEYVLITPKSRTFYFNEPRVPGLVRTVEDSGDRRVYHFLARHVAAVTKEALQPPWPEVLGHVNVSTYKTWEEMGRWYWGLVKDQFVPDDEVRRRALALTKGLKGDAAKVRAIYDYVVQKTRYVALEFGIHGYKPYRCAQIFARGFGDCKDKATLLVTMLQALGVKATPVIVRTGNKGEIEAAPASLAPFDHMIAYVPSLDLYLDGTAEYTGSLELPAMDRGALALQVNDGSAKLIHLPDPPASASVSVNRVDAVLGADGGAQLDWRAEIGGVEASEWRVRFHADATRARRVQELLAELLPGTQVTGVDSGNLEDIEQRVTMRARGRAPRFARQDGDILSVPLGRPEHMVRDYAPLPTRRLDVRTFAQWTTQDDWTVHLPPGAKIRNAPTSSKGSSPFGAYAVDVDSSGGALHVKTTVTLSATRVAVADYASFRTFCEEVDRALGQRATIDLRAGAAPVEATP